MAAFVYEWPRRFGRDGGNWWIECFVGRYCSESVSSFDDIDLKKHDSDKKELGFGHWEVAQNLLPSWTTSSLRICWATRACCPSTSLNCRFRVSGLGLCELRICQCPSTPNPFRVSGLGLCELRICQCPSTPNP
jgi:hypothetical protein